MRITARQLRKIIREVVEEESFRLDEETMSQAKVSGPLKDFFANLQTAKKSLGKSGARKALADLVANAGSDPAVMKKGERLLSVVQAVEMDVDRILKWMDSPAAAELTKDPWAHVGKRGL